VSSIDPPTGIHLQELLAWRVFDGHDRVARRIDCDAMARMTSSNCSKAS
jgi:hypothetical protein